MGYVRSRTLSAVAAIVLAAGGLAAASAVATQGPTAAPGPALEIRESVIEVVDIFPTSVESPDPKQVATGVLDLEAFDDDKSKVEVPVRVTAECECAPGTPEAEQFHNLIIEVHAHGGGKVYEGPLSQLNAEILKARKTKLKVWLADSGKPQLQGVETRFAFVATPVQ